MGTHGDSGWGEESPKHRDSGKGQGAGGQSQKKRGDSLPLGAEQGRRGMEETSRDTDLGVGVGGAVKWGGVKFGGKEHDSWH